MFLYGLGGFIGGLIFGAVLNMILLQNVPRQEWRNNPRLKMRYGALNWGIAFLGMFAALYVARFR